jgi:hypothetical protein
MNSARPLPTPTAPRGRRPNPAGQQHHTVTLLNSLD